MARRVLALLITLGQTCGTCAFGLTTVPRTLQPRTSVLRLVEGDADEIAALEEKLAKLKQAKAEEVAAEELGPATLADIDEGFDFATMSSRKKVAAVQSAAPTELLSEAWKEGEQDDAMTLSVNPAVVAALIVGFLAFSQVPIGQNIDSVTYGGKETRLESPDEIRARYSQYSLDES